MAEDAVAKSAPATSEAPARGERPARGARRGGRGGARGGARGGRGGKDDDKEWVPVTKLGRLVKDGRIKTIEEVYQFSLPIKEYQIIDYFFPKLVDEVVKITPVQKQTQAGQRTRFKAHVIVGDSAGHVGLGVKCAKEVATAIRGAIINAKLSIVPVRMGWWGTILGAPHTVPSKVTGKCGSVMTRLVPAPRGTGLVCSPTIKRVLELAGIQDVYTTACGKTKTRGNFVRATFNAISNTYAFKTPEMWAATPVLPLPYQEFSDYLHRASAGRR